MLRVVLFMKALKVKTTQRNIRTLINFSTIRTKSNMQWFKKNCSIYNNVVRTTSISKKKYYASLDAI